jgi:4-amino-4-deoxy-L-arabinose transferase-like glycosyltransferase
MQKIIDRKKHRLIVIFLLFFYFLITLFKLDLLPVFADESIYIRWTQLIIDDWQRYLFFPMNDGKTPLQMWLMLPFQFIFNDQLYAGRFLSVLIGAGSVFTMGLIAKNLINDKEKNKRLAQYLAMFLTSILPFTFFHNRLALTDGLLFFNLSLSFLAALKFIKSKKTSYLGLFVLFFLIALFSKFSALLFIPSTLMLIFYEKQIKIITLFKNFFILGFSLIITFSLFYLLRFVPVFPQLFSRGGDFLHPLNILLKKDVLTIVQNNLIFFSQQFIKYLGLSLFILALPLFSKKIKKEQIILVLAFLSFIVPLAALGKVIYPRYLLPSSIFIIASASLNLSFLFLNKNFLRKLLGFLLLIILIIRSISFILPSYFNYNQIPFSKADRVQYLEEWSSGHGILETTQLILEKSQNQRLALATEGYFGTLPDGILMYLHRRKVDNLMVEGIGQPVNSIPNSFIEKAKNYDLIWLVVNSHRFKINLEDTKLIKEYCRPNNAPCLQIWDISNLVKN